MTATVPYYGAQTPPTSPRFQADAPQPTSALQDIRTRLIDLREQASALASRLTQTADRGAGSVPQPGAANGAEKRPSSGAVQEINDVVSDVAAILAFAHEQAGRIERIV